MAKTATSEQLEELTLLIAKYQSEKPLTEEESARYDALSGLTVPAGVLLDHLVYLANREHVLTVQVTSLQLLLEEKLGRDVVADALKRVVEGMEQ